MAEVILTAENFEEEVLQAQGPVLVDFWAPWCGPCQMLLPVISELADEYEGRVKVCKLNVDDNTKLAIQYQVASIPTLLYFENGQLLDKRLGAVPKSEITSMFRL